MQSGPVTVGFGESIEWREIKREERRSRSRDQNARERPVEVDRTGCTVFTVSACTHLSSLSCREQRSGALV